jgi:hypothetical protein
VRQPSPLIQETGEGIRTVDLAGTTVTTKVVGPVTGDAFVVAETTLAPGGFEPPAASPAVETRPRDPDPRRHGAGVL